MVEGGGHRAKVRLEKIAQQQWGLFHSNTPVPFTDPSHTVRMSGEPPGEAGKDVSHFRRTDRVLWNPPRPSSCQKKGRAAVLLGCVNGEQSLLDHTNLSPEVPEFHWLMTLG